MHYILKHNDIDVAEITINRDLKWKVNYGRKQNNRKL
jgi:hypothetical protein